MVRTIEFVNRTGGRERRQVFLEVLLVPIAVRADLVFYLPATAQVAFEADVSEVCLNVVKAVAVIVRAARIAVQQEVISKLCNLSAIGLVRVRSIRPDVNESEIRREKSFVRFTNSDSFPPTEGHI